MTSFVFLWEDQNGRRCWEAVEKGQTEGFLKKLLSDGVHPATIMCAFSPIFFHWVFPTYHRGLSDVHFQNINDDIYGTAPVEKKHEPVNVPIEKPQPPKKFGWIAPDGRYFQCDYGGHSHLATKIVGEMESVLNPERHLEDHGWAKIFRPVETRERYAVGMGMKQKLTNAQVKTLQRMGLDHAYGVSALL